MSVFERGRNLFSRSDRGKPLPGELAAVGDVYKDLTAQGYPLMRTRDSRQKISGHSINVNTPAEPGGVYTNRFMVADGTTRLYYATYEQHNEVHKQPVVFAVAYGKMEGTEDLTIVGAAHHPSWNWWHVDRKFRSPEYFNGLVSEHPGRFSSNLDHFSFRIGLDRERDTFNITTGDSSTVNQDTVPAVAVLHPITRREGIALVRETLFTTLDQKFSPEKYH